MIALVSIDYDEGDQSTYRGIEIRIKIKTGNPVADFANARQFLTQLVEDGDLDDFLYTSSVDHFVMYCAGYRWALESGNNVLLQKEPVNENHGSEDT